MVEATLHVRRCSWRRESLYALSAEVGSTVTVANDVVIVSVDFTGNGNVEGWIYQ